MTFESEQKRFSLPVASEIGLFFGDLDESELVGKKVQVTIVSRSYRY